MKSTPYNDFNLILKASPDSSVSVLDKNIPKWGVRAKVWKAFMPSLIIRSTITYLILEMEGGHE